MGFAASLTSGSLGIHGAIGGCVSGAVGMSGSSRATVVATDAARAAVAADVAPRAQRTACPGRTAGTSPGRATRVGAGVAHTEPPATRQGGSDAGAEAKPQKQVADRCRFHRRNPLQERVRRLPLWISGAYAPASMNGRDFGIRAFAPSTYGEGPTPGPTRQRTVRRALARPRSDHALNDGAQTRSGARLHPRSSLIRRCEASGVSTVMFTIRSGSLGALVLPAGSIATLVGDV
jgi:hypothetical protein